jgi:hypothetical protein
MKPESRHWKTAELRKAMDYQIRQPSDKSEKRCETCAHFVEKPTGKDRCKSGGFTVRASSICESFRGKA